MKTIPAFMLLYPLARRDGRGLAGAAVGLFVGGFVLPAVAWGPGPAVDLTARYVEVILLPPLGLGKGDGARDKELLEVTATDNQSMQATIHNHLYPDAKARPGHTSWGTKGVHAGLTLVLTAATLLALRRAKDGTDQLLIFGCWRW